jgi:hypothetical protein
MTADDIVNEVMGNGGAALPRSFDDALSGIVRMPFNGSVFAVYGLMRLGQVVAEQNEWSQEEGDEWVAYNIQCIATDEQGPLFMVEAGDPPVSTAPCFVCEDGSTGD